MEPKVLKPKPINASGIIWTKTPIIKKSVVLISTSSAFKKFSKEKSILVN